MTADPAGEVVGLDQSIAYAEHLATLAGHHSRAGNEGYLAHLVQFRVTGLGLSTARRMQQAFADAAAAAARHATALTRQKTVQEQYDANPDAGDKDYQQANRATGPATTAPDPASTPTTDPRRSRTDHSPDPVADPRRDHQPMTTPDQPHRGPRAEADWPPVPASMTKRCDNRSVGVLITDPQGRLLMFTRTTPPVGRAPVAGHGDDHGDAMATARDEVAEEVGLTVTDLTLAIAPRWRDNICRRQHGPAGPGHNWTVFRAAVTGQVHTDPAESRDAAWYTRAELQHLADRTIAHARGEVTAAEFAADPGLEPVWVEFLADAGFIRVDRAGRAAAETLARRSPYAEPAGQRR